MTYLRYSTDLEDVGEDETATFEAIVEAFADMGRKVAEQEGRAVRVSHAKATAELTGELTVEPGLPAELAQGLAARPGTYRAVIRFAQGPGEHLHDRVSTHRGLAIKLLGVAGDRLAESDETDSQDFVLEARTKAFINSTAKTFLANLRGGVSNAPMMSEAVKNAVSNVARGTEAALEAVGLEAKTLGFFGHPSVHPLSEAYFSQVPMRWGDFVGKLGCYPTPATLDSLDELDIDARDDHDAFRTAMVRHFAEHGAQFEVRVQLATSLEETPIEDAAVTWPEDDNPYRTVARLDIPPQPAWSPARDGYVDRLSFRPGNSIELHRPLGQVMRARMFAYGRLAEMRRAMNHQDAPEPAAAIPA